MDLAGKIKNAFSAFTKTENSGAQGVSGTDFLKYGNRGRKIMWDESSNVKMSDVEFYKGYSYAAINNRANKVAQLAEENLKTKAADKMMADARARNEDIVHPYLTLIDESDDFTNYEFWYAISTYLDLEGVYYLMAVRAVSPSLIGNVQSFVMLNPYNVQRVINKETMQVGGYIETVNGMQREIPKEMIIEMRKLNPFSNDTNFAMTDAAKDSQFTLQQANDYTRSSLKNNLSAPGIITTDVLMDREMFQNFQARVLSQEKGAPLFGNGAGSINYEPMQIDMDKAALLDINKMSRDQLFAVTGVSPSTLGIDESGTTRDVSKTQKDKFIEDHIMPQMQLIFDALNQDYKKYYKKEWDKNKYRIYVDNPLSADKDAESKDIEMADSSYKLYDQLVADGYDRDIAAKYSAGEITLEELGEPTNEPRPNPIVEAAMLKAGDNPQNPNLVAPKEDTKKKDDTSKKKPSDEKKIESLLTQNHEEFEHEHEIDMAIIKNAFDSETNQLIDTQQASLENGIQNVEGEVVAKILTKVQRTKNAFDEQSDMMSARDKAMFINELTVLVAGYYSALFPVFANQLIKTRAKEFGQQGNFRMTNAIKRYIQVTARRASDSHINTIINDIQKVAHDAYEEELARHLKDAKDTGKSGAESYEYARKRALEGASQQRIISEITTKYQDISKNRAKTIARTETNRAFTQSQFQADVQFLKDTGMMENAYKQWVTRSENPCPYCLELESRGPIPFNENFESMGAELHYDYTKKNGEIVKRTLKIDYEDLEAGNAHVNCQCKYKLLIKTSDGFVENNFDKVENRGYNPNRDPKSGKFSFGKGKTKTTTGSGEPTGGYITKEVVDRFSSFSLADQTRESLNEYTLKNDYKKALNQTRKDFSPITGAAGGSWTPFENANYIKSIALKSKPKIVGDSEYMALKNSGDYITVYRNAGKKEYITAFKNGSNKMNSFHMFGAGVYFAADKKFAAGGEFAKGSDPDGMFEALIPKKKVIEHSFEWNSGKTGLSPDVEYLSSEGKGVVRGLAQVAADRGLSSILTGNAGLHVRSNDEYDDKSFSTEQYVITNPSYVVVRGDS